MNPLTKVKLINELNEREANLGIKESVSWHAEYKDSAWVFIGGFPYELTEGDLVCVFSQYGEIANINLVRDKKTGKSKGFCFLCYEDQRSTILAVDNFNGIKIKGRTIRVDHVSNYRPPKDSEDIDDVTRHLREEGCAPKSESEDEDLLPLKKPKKDKKEKKKKKEKKEKKKEAKEKKRTAEAEAPFKVKEEKDDTAYEKYALKEAQATRKERQREDPQWREERERGRDEERRRGRSRDDARERELQQRSYERDGDMDRSRERDGDIDRQKARDRRR